MAPKSATAEPRHSAGPRTGAEERAIERHRKRLSDTRGKPISQKEAVADWLDRHAQAWRERRQAECLRLQEEEIRQHKWIESEKADRDLGKAAVMDWIANHAANWRIWYESEYDDGESA